MGWRKGRKIGKEGRKGGRKEGRKKEGRLSNDPRKSWRHNIWIPAGTHKSMRSLPKSLYKPHGSWLHFQTGKVLGVEETQVKASLGSSLHVPAAPPSWPFPSGE